MATGHGRLSSILGVLLGAALVLAAASAAPASVIHLPDDQSQFRSIDGNGNNIDNPGWGQADAVLLRLTRPAYGDGFNLPAGAGRPGARAISNAVAAQDSFVANSAGLSNMFWQWGQFLDHDIDEMPIADAEALPIPVPTGDLDFDPSGSGSASIGFTRSDFVVDGAGVRQQMNAITAYIDASNVYGSDDGRAADLRAGEGGRLVVAPGGFLPDDPDDPGMFLSGDNRVNEQIGLAAMHTLWLREHNRAAAEIATRYALDPVADDELIYQLARTHVGAAMQAITYNEWLPLLLGDYAPGSYAGYDPGVNATISTEFATAAFRFGHTMLPDSLALIGPDGTVTERMGLRDVFFVSDPVRDNGIEAILRGLAGTSAQEIDTLITDDVRNFLFGRPGAGGFDLAALNIQRGRDHGLGSLNAVRADLGLEPWLGFLAMTGGDADLAAAFAAIYGSVDEVDLWIGGLAEAAIGDSLLGETFTTILMDQFFRLRAGDRFWYEAIFGPEAVAWYEVLTLGDIIRLNTGVGDWVGTGSVFLTQHIPAPAPLTLLVIAFGAIAATCRRAWRSWGRSSCGSA